MWRRCVTAGLVICSLTCGRIDASIIRMVTYNTASSGDFGAPTTARTGFETIMEAIGKEIVNGNARQIDVFSLQEQSSTKAASGASITSKNIADRLNAIYGADTYAAATITGGSSGSGTQGLVYNTNTIKYYSAKTVGSTNGNGMARQELRFDLGVKGFGNYADFSLYSGHWKASEGASNEARRAIEANALRADANTLPAGKPVLYTGDFNTYSGSDDGFVSLTTSGPTRGIDPLNKIGNWHNNPNYISIASQAPAVNPSGSLTGGGLNDRFDFILPSNPAMPYYAAGSYHSFGNNGSVRLSDDIDDSSNTALAGMPNRLDVLEALTEVSDHLPVVMDFNLPDPAAEPLLTMSLLPPPPQSESMPEPSSAGVMIVLTLLSSRRLSRREKGRSRIRTDESRICNPLP